MPTLHWIGKEKVINHHRDVPFKVLEHKYGFDNGVQSNNPTNSGNLIIHGDNLEALKALLPQYEGKVDCICIDPPYNTGNENWIYNDNVNHPKITKWLGEVVGKEGDDLSRHDKWLCMMYPRLKLLHQLLSKNGVIFICINFIHEHPYLRLIMDEIFGKSNYIGELTWESTTQPINSGSAKFGLQQKVEPIMFYAKNKKQKQTFILKEIDSGLKYPHIGKLGACRFEVIEKSDAGSYERNTMKFPILGQFPRPGKRWQIGQDLAIELEKNNRLEIIDGLVKRAIYPEDELDKQTFVPFWSHFQAEIYGTAQTGKDLLNTILGRAVGFDTVKPVKLIEEILSHFSKNSIFLDSFAGSGTTAHAIINLNKVDNGNRKFICVEMEDYADNITSQRIKNSIVGYDTDKGSVEGTGGSFDFYELGKPIFVGDNNEYLNEEIDLEKIRQYIWYSETRSPYTKPTNVDSDYFLGKKEETAYYFIYEKSAETTLDYDLLSEIKTKSQQYVIYADNCLLAKEFMMTNNITFKKIPRDVTRF